MNTQKLDESSPLRRLVDQVAEDIPEVADAPLAVYDIRDGLRFLGCDMIPPAAVREPHRFSDRLAELGAGRPWVRIAGEGFLRDGRFLISVHPSPELRDGPPPLVEISGPALGADGSTRRGADVLVGALEEIAARLAQAAREPLGKRLLGSYGRRRLGDWSEITLESWDAEEFRAFAQCLWSLIGEETARGEGRSKNLDGFREYLMNLVRLMERCKQDPRMGMMKLEPSPKEGPR